MVGMGELMWIKIHCVYLMSLLKCEEQTCPLLPPYELTMNDPPNPSTYPQVPDPPARPLGPASARSRDIRG